MASYHTSLSYLGKNSAEQGYIIAAFEPDEGFKDTFLDMDQISEDYYDGTKKFLYGTRYNSTASINITFIKMDGTGWSVSDNRKVLRWLTGARTASWLDLYQGDEIKYSFLGTVKSPQQYKLDGRVIGISFEFASITPWAYSSERKIDTPIKQGLYINADNILSKRPENNLSVDKNGHLWNGIPNEVNSEFYIDDDGVIYIHDTFNETLQNDTDDLYSYIYLDIDFFNSGCSYLEIKNKTLNEITRIDDLKPEDVICITNRQFIVAYTKNKKTGELESQNRIFGDSFNFVWPRLTPGPNNFTIEGDGNGTVRFSYRFPIKIGDCAMDNIDDIGSFDISTGSKPTYGNTIRWQDITGTPTTIAGYGITDAYTETEVEEKLYAINEKIYDIENSGGTGAGGSIVIDEDELNAMLGDILA